MQIERTAERRFREVLEGRLANGIWLEHSTSYQFLAIRVVERFLRLVGGDDELAADLEAMRRRPPAGLPRRGPHAPR